MPFSLIGSEFSENCVRSEWDEELHFLDSQVSNLPNL